MSGVSARPAAGAAADWLCPGVRVLITSRFGVAGGGPDGGNAGPYGALNMSYRVGDDPAAVRRNRDLVLHRIGPGVGRLAWMRQVHGAAVAYVPGGESNAPDAKTNQAGAPEPDAPEADAQFTGAPGVALAVEVADCAAVLVADPVAGLIGAAHAGRPGMAAGVVEALVMATTVAGAVPDRMHALIGPAICGQCYEVPEEMRSDVAARVPGSACQTRQGTPGIDLRAGLHGQLAALGVGTVADDARCTAESAELYSYRRDGVTGRFAGVIWLSAERADDA